MKNIYTSVDIGSDTIKIVVCELVRNKLNLLAASSVKSKGITKGLVTNFEDAQHSLKLAFSEIEQMLGTKVEHALVSVPSYFADYVMIDGSVNILSDDHVITGEDIDRVIESAIANKKYLEKQLLLQCQLIFQLMMLLELKILKVK